MFSTERAGTEVEQPAANSSTIDKRRIVFIGKKIYSYTIDGGKSYRANLKIFQFENLKIYNLKTGHHGWITPAQVLLSPFETWISNTFWNLEPERLEFEI